MLLEIMVTIYIIIIKKLSLTPRNIKTEIENLIAPLSPNPPGLNIDCYLGNIPG